MIFNLGREIMFSQFFKPFGHQAYSHRFSPIKQPTHFYWILVIEHLHTIFVLLCNQARNTSQKIYSYLGFSGCVDLSTSKAALSVTKKRFAQYLLL